MSEKTVERMAKYIMNADVDYCSECCADYEACNAELGNAWKGHENDLYFTAPVPKKQQCINGIIRFFEEQQ